MAGAAATAFAASFSHPHGSPSLGTSSSLHHYPLAGDGAPSSQRSRSSSLSSLSSSSSLGASLHHGQGTKRPRSPSISGDTDDLLSDDDPLTASNNYGFDARVMETVRCEWGGSCGAEFWEVEPLVEHVHSIHAFPDDLPHHPAPKKTAGSAASSYVCDWAGCARRGKTQGSKFALVAHLRSHTGEKPFHCPRPECDKSFTRTDALQKHMRVQHGDVIVTANAASSSRPSGAGDEGAPAAKKGKGAKGKGKGKGRAKREASEDSAFGGAAAGGADDDYAPPPGAAGEDDPSLFAYDSSSLLAMSSNPSLPPDFVAYVVNKAKYRYLLNEHEGLAGELEALNAREAELGAEREVLLRGILRREVGDSDPSPESRQALEQFLTNYSHEPAAYPADFVSK